MSETDNNQKETSNLAARLADKERAYSALWNSSQADIAEIARLRAEHAQAARERDELSRMYAELDEQHRAEVADYSASLTAAHAEHAQAARDRDEFARMYVEACNAGAEQSAEIARLNEALGSCDSTRLAEELEAERNLKEEIKRNADALYVEYQLLATNCNATTARAGELRKMLDSAEARIIRLQRERDEARKSAETLQEDFTEAERQAKLSAEQVIDMRRAADETIQTLINASGWLDVLADGYMRETATPNGARNLAARLRSCVKALAGE
jgi:chromosome segregation ATPase